MKKLTIASIFLLASTTAFAQTKKDTIREIETVEIFGERNKKQRGLETVTRFPVNPQNQPQSISIISEKLIEDQGALTITDVARNVPGVTLFGSYGGNRESMSIRGFRGTPVLKNGIRMDSDFRTGAGVIEMQGVESVQVIRGAAAITQGLGNGLGSGGGLINLVTKTPRYNNETEIGVRAGSWNQIRTTLDAQRVYGKKQNIGFRLNAAYEQSDSYRDVINKDRFYINPSFAWKIDDKTQFVAELDYLNGEGTPDRGTINSKGSSENGLIDMGSKFMGYNVDNEEYKTLSYTAKITREISDKINVRLAFMANDYERDAIGATLSGSGFTRRRGLSHSARNDKNTTLQIDILGKDFKFGNFKWEWQLGYDISSNKTDSKTYTDLTNIDVIDVREVINNNIDLNSDQLNSLNTVKSNTVEKMTSYGFLTQHHLTFAEKFKLIGALRYSYTNDYSEDAIDPMVGLMYSPAKNINVYTTYSTITSLRQMGNPMIDGSTSGPAVTGQFEAGVKTSWFEDRFRANINYFNMNQSDLTYQYYDPTTNAATNFYEYAGNLRRTGVEFEVAGRLLPNLQVLLGYSYTDAYYNNSPSYVNGSRPMNSPYNTGNAWAQYTFQDTNSFLDGLYVALGYYYIGSRPVNEYNQKYDAHGSTAGEKPFLMPDYYTLNAQVGYKIGKFNFRILMNNLTDQLGYNSYYRGGYINQIDPFNMAGQIVFKF